MGSEVDRAGGFATAVALADKAGLPVWAAPTESGTCFSQTHPHFQGFLPPAIAHLSAQLSGHDLIVVVGAPVFRYYPYVPGSYLPAGAELVHLTSDPGEAARAPVGDAIVGNVGVALAALADQVQEKPRKVPERAVPRPAAQHQTDDAMTPNTVFATLARVLPEDTL